MHRHAARASPSRALFDQQTGTQVNIWYCEISQSLRNTATKCRVSDPADIEII
jgi:hypothetical protein